MEGNKKTESPILVEFLGLPGSGKTTVYNSITESLEEKGLNIKKTEQETRNFNKKYSTFQKYLIIPFIFYKEIFHTFINFPKNTDFLITKKPP